MNKRVEKIEPISRIYPVRKIVLRNPQRDGRELMYQFNNYPKLKKRKVSQTALNESGEDQKKSKVSSDVISEEIKDIKKRLVFDRAKIIRDES